jgi:hypothetical protein
VKSRTPATAAATRPAEINVNVVREGMGGFLQNYGLRAAGYGLRRP